MIQINQIKLKLPINNEIESLKKEVLKHYPIKENEITTMEINKKSLDARKKPDLFYTYCVTLKLSSIKLEERLIKGKAINVTEFVRKDYEFPKVEINDSMLMNRPVIIGSGPAGLFAAYFLSMSGCRPILLERGKDVDSRTKIVQALFSSGILNKDCNVCFGEGGAGTFSDGKLQTQVKDKTGRIRKVLEIFVEHGANPSILYENKPHIGTDVLSNVVKNMREHMIANGAEVHFESTFTGLLQRNNSVVGVLYKTSDGKTITLETNICILAIGHSARDTFYQLHQQNISMENKPFAVGLRIQHDQNKINESQYGQGWEKKGLPAADYKLTYQAKSGRGVYSFCMCPGGYIINASNEEGEIVVNGMSFHDRASGNANSAIVITVDESVYGKQLFDGIRFQQQLEKMAYKVGNGSIALECYGDYKADKQDNFSKGSLTPRVKGLYEFGPVSEILPKNFKEDFVEAIDHFGQIINGFDSNDAILCGIESRTSSPIKILRNEDLESNIHGLFPCGEGAGYAGGITSAAVDGIKVAEKVVLLYNR